jgi:vitamin B12 transporter
MKSFASLKTAIFSLLFPILFLQAENSNIVIEVESTRIKPVATPDSTPLQGIPGLKLRQQGRGNPQTDLSIRGSAFNSTGLMLNRLSKRNAQTEHWHASLTTPDSWLEKPYILTGLDRFKASTGHPSGSVELTLAPLLSDENRLTIGGGNYGNFFSGLEMTTVKTLEDSTVGASAFINYNHADKTDSHADNYLDRVVTGGRVSRLSDKTQADLLTTVSYSEFGAQEFYGASSQYPAEEELLDAMVMGSLRFIEEPENPAVLTALWRRTEDTYTLDRNNPSFYKNEHTTDFFALHGDKRAAINQTFSIDSRADIDLETIKCRSLGNHHRSHASLALIPNVAIGNLRLSAGGSLELYSSDSAGLLPATGIEWDFAEDHTLFLNYTESLRQPSYTELNYKSPFSLGNSGLDRQHTRTTEAGYKGEADIFKWNISAFYEYSDDVVDWIKHTNGGRWSSENLDTIKSIGLSALGSISLSDKTELTLEALVLDKDCNQEIYASRYALDYPEFSTDIRVTHDISRDLMLRVNQEFSKYEDNPVREHSNWFINSSIDLQWKLPTKHDLALNAGIRNIFDDDFQFFPGQDTIGRSVFTSLTYTW